MLHINQLRTTDPTKIPVGLDSGQIAFNLANDWMFVGDGSDVVSIAGETGSVSGTYTIFGKSITVPTPATGKGYCIHNLKASKGVEISSGAPTGTYVAGDLYVDTTTSNQPDLKVYTGSAWVSVHKDPQIFSLTTTAVNAATGADTSARITAELTANNASISASGDIKPGATALVTGAQVSTVAPDTDPGTYVYDGSNWTLTGGNTPVATTRSQGVVQLATNNEVKPSTATGSATPTDPSVATALQLKALANQVASLATGAQYLGTYDGSTGGGQIAALSAAGTSAGFSAAGKIGAGGTAQIGDYFLVTKAGTLTGEAVNITTATVVAGDRLFFDGVEWQKIDSGLIHTGATLHSLDDVSDSSVTTPVTNQKGVLVRDGSVTADGFPSAYKLTDTIDAGTF